MGRVILTLPRLGETMEEAKVVEWLVPPGAAFKRGDVLLEVETDKTVVEVPAMTDGVLTAQLVAPGETVALDQPIAEVEAEGGPVAAPTVSTPTSETQPAAVGKSAPTEATPTLAPTATAVPFRPTNRPPASPAARAAARRSGTDLTTLHGTGRRGRITTADVTAQSHSGQIALHTTAGNGPPMILLHGLFDDHRGWRDLPRRLAAAGHSVIALDLPGHGDSTAQADSLETATGQIAATLPAGPLRLFGHSLGAAIAVRLALRLGSRVESLILSAPAGLGARINPAFTDGMLAAETPAALARALALLDAGPVSLTTLTQELNRLRTLRPGHSALAVAVAHGGFQQIDITADLARLTCPVTVLFGTDDRILDWRDVANLPATTAIHLIGGAGHLPHLTAPDLVVRLATASLAPVRRLADA